MSTLLEKYELDQKRRGLSQNTIVLRNRQFALYEKEVGPVEKMAPDQVQEWLDGRDISDKTRSCYLTTFSAFFKWAIKHDHLRVNPIEKIDRPKLHNGMPNPMPEKSLAYLIEHATPLLRCWIAFEAYAGLRCQEVAYLEHEDIDRVEGRIHVRKGKGGKERYVPEIHPKIIEALYAYEAPTTEGRLWPYVTPSNVSQRLNRYFHANGVKHTAHKLRHRFGTVAYQASGQSLLTTQRLLGHSNPSTTAIYAAVSDEEGRAAIRSIA